MSAEISIVLPADTVETIAPVVGSLQRLGAGNVLEIVVVVPEMESRDVAARLGDVKVAIVPSVYPLSRARAAGVRAASAPFVFIGETHSFPRPGMLDVLLRAHREGWCVTVPVFENENPDSLVSWAAFLSGYAAWTAGIPAGELNHAPLFNVSYRRDFLLGLGDDLEHTLTTGEDMMGRLRAAACGVWLEPVAKIGHVNMTFAGAWLKQRLAAGRVIASIRSRRWSRFRRLSFALGAPLIPLVLLARIRHGVMRAIRSGQVSPAVLPVLATGMIAQSLGELVGYAAGGSAGSARSYDEYEVRQSAFSRWLPPTGEADGSEYVLPPAP